MAAVGSGDLMRWPRMILTGRGVGLALPYFVRRCFVKLANLQTLPGTFSEPSMNISGIPVSIVTQLIVKKCCRTKFCSGDVCRNKKSIFFICQGVSVCCFYFCFSDLLPVSNVSCPPPSHHFNIHFSLVRNKYLNLIFLSNLGNLVYCMIIMCTTVSLLSSMHPCPH